MLTFKQAVAIRHAREHAPMLAKALLVPRRRRSRFEKEVAPGIMRAGITPIIGSPIGPGVLRHVAAHTGDPLIDAILDNPVTADSIDYPVVDRSSTVPYGAGGSVPIDDPTTFVDEHVPDTMTVSGVTFDPAEPWVVHENIEQMVMEILILAGMSAESAYKVAHFLFAEVAEGAWYRAHGIDQEAAEAQEAVWLDQIQYEDPSKIPPNLYLKPYPHDDAAMARDEPLVEPHPTAAEIAQAFAILVPMFLANVAKDDAGPHLDKDNPTVNYVADWSTVATQCVRCSMFLAMRHVSDDRHGCTLIIGDINRHGHCDRFDELKKRDVEVRDQPKTLYVKRRLLNGADLVAWAKAQGFDTALEPDDMHVTIAYSKAPVDWSLVDPDATNLVVRDATTDLNGTRSIERMGDGDAVSLLFHSPELSTRWDELCAAGAVWKWPSYRPHVTISWNAPDIDVDAIPPYDGPLLFGPEEFAEVKDGWSDTITEKVDDMSTMEVSRELHDRVYTYLLKADPAVAAIMAKANLLAKSQPGATDVHVRTAPGLLNTDTQPRAKPAKAKSKSFKVALDEMRAAGHAAVEPPEDADVGKADWSIPFDIVKQDEDQQLVFGWASVSSVGGQLIVDKQDDVIMEDDLEKAAYDFVLYCREQGDMHERKGVGRMVESMMFTKQKQDLLGIDLGMVGWWVGFKVDTDDVWKDIKAGNKPEFSIGGKAKRVPIDG